MDAVHPILSGASDHDGLSKCQYCGWIYPNPHPSAKLRRNHKMYCGKLKEFVDEGCHRGGSSDEASSDDLDNKEGHSPLTFTLKPSEVATVVHDVTVETHACAASNVQEKELLIVEEPTKDVEPVEESGHMELPVSNGAPILEEEVPVDKSSFCEGPQWVDEVTDQMTSLQVDPTMQRDKCSEKEDQMTSLQVDFTMQRDKCSENAALQEEINHDATILEEQLATETMAVHFVLLQENRLVNDTEEMASISSSPNLAQIEDGADASSLQGEHIDADENHITVDMDSLKPDNSPITQVVIFDDTSTKELVDILEPDVANLVATTKYSDEGTTETLHEATLPDMLVHHMMSVPDKSERLGLDFTGGTLDLGEGSFREVMESGSGVSELQPKECKSSIAMDDTLPIVSTGLADLLEQTSGQDIGWIIKKSNNETESVHGAVVELISLEHSRPQSFEAKGADSAGIFVDLDKGKYDEHFGDAVQKVSNKFESLPGAVMESNILEHDKLESFKDRRELPQEERGTKVNLDKRLVQRSSPLPFSKRSDSLETEHFEDAREYFEDARDSVGSFDEYENAEDLHMDIVKDDEASTSAVGFSAIRHLNSTQDLRSPSPEAWQDPGLLKLDSQENEVQIEELVQEEVIARDSEDDDREEKDIKQHTALRSLMAKEVTLKRERAIVEKLHRETPDVKDSKWGSGERKPKPRSIWSHCICCPAVH